MRYAIFLTLLFASSAYTADVQFECRSIAGLPNDVGARHPSDTEQPMFRVEYRSPSDPMRLTLKGDRIARQEQTHLPPEKRQGTRLFEGQVLASDMSGRIWTFTTNEFPDGPVEYVYDSNRGVLVRTNTTYNYARGFDAPPETGKPAIVIYIYQCSVAVDRRYSSER